MKRKIDLSTTTSITTTYEGEYKGQIISAALLSGKTLAEENLTIKPNINFKEVIQKIATDDIVKDASCDFSPQSTLTLSERVLQVEEFQVNLQLCKKDFVSSYLGMEMLPSAMGRQLPDSFADFLMTHVADKVSQRIETTIWNGTNATSGQFDGFKTTLLADSDVVDVSGTSSTTANVIDEIQKIFAAIPSAVFGEEDLLIYLPSNMYRNYISALGGFGSSGLGAAGTDNKGPQWYGGGPLSFSGVKIAHAPGLASDTAVAAQKSNLFFGCSLLSDTSEAKLIDMTDIDGSNNVRVILRYAAGIQHGIGSDIVLYS